MNNKIGYGHITVVYEGIDNEVSTVSLGDGGTRIATVYTPSENTAGISFAQSPNKVSVGDFFIKNSIPTDPNEDPMWQQKNAYIQIVSDNPASIDVLIERLKEAKQRLLDMEGQQNEHT